MARKKSSTPESLTCNFKPLNCEQRKAMQSLKRSSISFLTGPPGTAKTFVATAWGMLRMLHHDTKLHVTRPAIQQGVELGYLPGTAEQKVCPFLEPIFDAVEVLCGEERAKEARTKIKIMPLSMIRGRTIRNSTLIVDEAQNLTWAEIETIATRIGENGQIIFCGDVSQNDHKNGRSRLEDAASMLNGVSVDEHRICWYQFSEQAIVRHPLIPEIIKTLHPASPASTVPLRNGRGCTEMVITTIGETNGKH